MRDTKGRFVKGFPSETRPFSSVKVVCPTCSKHFFVQPHRFLSGRGKFCSMSCRRFTEDTKNKMSLKRKGKPTGRTGDKSHFWKGGVTPINKKIRMSLDIRNWRNSVFIRDDYTCQMCGVKGGKLQADHIKPFSLYPELRFAIDNGRTLCILCHKKTDTYGGKLNKNEKN